MTVRDHSNLFVATTLNGGIAAGALSLTLHDAVAADLSVPFALTLESGSVTSEEVVLVTALDGTRKICTITRGYDGTTAKIHADGATVNHTAIAADFNDPLVSGAAAGGVLTGTYPNPGFAIDMATQAELDTAIATRQPLFGPQVANTLYAGPASGPAAAPAFRASVKADLPGVVAYEDEANIFTLGPNLFAAGADANVALAARRHSSGATGNIQEWQSEAGAALSFVRPDGTLHGPNVEAGAQGAAYYSAFGNSVHAYIAAADTITDLAAHNQVNVFDANLLINDAAIGATTTILNGAVASISVDPAHQRSFQQLSALFFYTENDGAGDIASHSGVNGFVYHGGSGAIEREYGAWLGVGAFGSGPITGEAAGLRIDGGFAYAPVNMLAGILIKDQYPDAPSASEVYSIHTAGGPLHFGDYLELPEITAPLAAAANTGRLFVRDNGAGKSQLAIRFPSGAIQVIATEP